MKVHKLALLTATLALGAAPTLALAATPGPHASLPAKAKAYGRYCKGESKAHVAGTRGTPFSKCVTDMAKLATRSVKSARQACKDESRKHIAHHPGTPYSLCVSGGATLLKRITPKPHNTAPHPHKVAER